MTFEGGAYTRYVKGVDHCQPTAGLFKMVAFHPYLQVQCALISLSLMLGNLCTPQLTSSGLWLLPASPTRLKILEGTLYFHLPQNLGRYRHSLASKSRQSRMHFNFGFCSLIRCRTSQILTTCFFPGVSAPDFPSAITRIIRIILDVPSSVFPPLNL